MGIFYIYGHLNTIKKLFQIKSFFQFFYQQFCGFFVKLYGLANLANEFPFSASIGIYLKNSTTIFMKNIACGMYRRVKLCSVFLNFNKVFNKSYYISPYNYTNAGGW